MDCLFDLPVSRACSAACCRLSVTSNSARSDASAAADGLINPVPRPEAGRPAEAMGVASARAVTFGANGPSAVGAEPGMPLGGSSGDGRDGRHTGAVVPDGQGVIGHAGTHRQAGP